MICNTKEEFIEYLKTNYEGLYKFAMSLKKRTRKNNRQSVIALTGRVRTGKSCFGLILDILIDDHFDLKQNCLFIPDASEIEKEFKSLKQYSVYHIDEAIRGTYKMDFASNVQKSLVKLYNTEAWKNITSLLCIPRFKSLASDFRNDIVDVWIHVLQRGHIVVYIREDNPRIDDPWNDKDNQKIYVSGLKKFKNTLSADFDYRLELERRTKNYFADFEFPNIEEIFPSFYKAYENAKIESRTLEPEAVEEGVMVTSMRNQRARLHLYIKEKYGIKNTVMGRLTGLSSQAVANDIAHAKRLKPLIVANNIQSLEPNEDLIINNTTKLITFSPSK